MEHHKSKQKVRDQDKSTSAVQRLIDDGTLPLESYLDWQDTSGQTILHLIAQSNTNNALELIRRIPVKALDGLFTVDSQKRNPLHYAAINGNLALIRILFPVAVRLNRLQEKDGNGMDAAALAALKIPGFSLSPLDTKHLNSPSVADVQLAELIHRALQERRVLDFNTATDGSCQFDAIAIGLNQLPIPGAGGFSAESVKQIIVDYIREHQEEYAGFNIGNLDEYLQNVLDHNEWGNHLTLHAAANAFNIDITVLSSQPGLPNILVSPSDTVAQHSIVIAHFFELHYFGTRPLGPEANPGLNVLEDLTHQQMGSKILSQLRQKVKVSDKNAADALSSLFMHLRLRGGANADPVYGTETVQGYIKDRFHFAGLLVESAFTKITTMVESGLPENKALKKRNKKLLNIRLVQSLWKDFLNLDHLDVIDVGSACLPQIYGVLRWFRKNGHNKKTSFDVHALDRSEDWQLPFNFCLLQMWRQQFNIKATLTIKDVVNDPNLSLLSKSKKLIVSSFCVSENYAEAQLVPVLRNAAQLCEVGSVAYFQDRDIKGYIKIIEMLQQHGFVVIFEYKRTRGHERKEWGTEAQRPECPEFEDKALYIVCLIKLH